MKYSIETDKGKVRSVNQDRCDIFFPDQTSCFAVVCDGMGGANAGEVAAELALETVVSRVKAGWRKGITAESVKNLLTTSITAANINVFDKACSDVSCEGMGTTIVACAVLGPTLIVAHAGDSRAYVYSGALHQLTKDHSFVQTLVDMGKITDEQAKNHPQKNYITRALGIEENIDIDFVRYELCPGDIILLCSDGLSNYIAEDQIVGLLQQYGGSAAKELIEKANANGGGDNISAVVISNS